MLRDALRHGLRAVRSAGWRAYALGLLSYGPVVTADLLDSPLLVVATFVLQIIVGFALIRLLGAWRPEPVPAPPQVDDQGRRVLTARRPGPPLGPADAGVGGALTSAFRLWRPAVSFAGLVVLAQLGALLTVFALSGGQAAEYEPDVVLLAALPVSALFLAFVALAPQRIALEGEPRVLVAAAHSVRIARTAYGVLLLLTIVEPAVTALGGLLVPDKSPPLGLAIGVGAAVLVVAAGIQVVTTAVANEVYLAGPRLDLPVDPGA